MSPRLFLVMTSSGVAQRAATHISVSAITASGTPSWSPDGTRIAWDVGGGAVPTIFLFPTGGGHAKVLTRGSDPAWSPDGTKLAFVRAGVIRIADADGGAQRSLVAGFSPSWSPDGRELAFWRHTAGPRSSIYVIDPTGTG